MSIVENRKAFHDYFIEERFEAGHRARRLGSEGDPRRAARTSRKRTSSSRTASLMLIGAHITPLTTASTHVHADPTRTRKLLLHREEINRLIGKVERAGYTLDADRPALQQGPRQARDRPRQGQEAARQARDDQGARMEPRAAAAAARPRHAGQIAGAGVAARRGDRDQRADVAHHRTIPRQRAARRRCVPRLPASRGTRA